MIKILPDNEITILNVDDQIRAFKRRAYEEGKPIDTIAWGENGWKCLLQFARATFPLPDGTKYLTYMGVNHTQQRYAK